MFCSRNKEQDSMSGANLAEDGKEWLEMKLKGQAGAKVWGKPRHYTPFKEFIFCSIWNGKILMEVN